MAEAAGGTLSQVVQASPPPPKKIKKNHQNTKKESKSKKINDRQKSFTASRHSIQPVQTNQNGSSSG